MKKFFVRYTADFGNTYDLCYTEDGSEPEGYERITRKEAEGKARAEARRRKDDPSFAYYAPEYITPYFPGDDGEKAEDAKNDALTARRKWTIDGRIIIKK